MFHFPLALLSWCCATHALAQKHVITNSAKWARSVFAIDLDGDSDVDVLSASYGDDTVAWYENDGSQNFTKHVITNSANGAESVFAIDVDGDGDVDVLSASDNDDTVAWYEQGGVTSRASHPFAHIPWFAHPYANTDLSELAVLSGDCDYTMNLTASALKALGWERGVVSTFNMLAPPYLSSNDQAMTFIKNDHCLAVFQGMNEATDQMQVVGGLQSSPADLCGFKVHAGVAQEMGSFLASPKFAEFVAFLNNGKCKTVTAVGHSFGGALATLWATCANLGATVGGKSLGTRKDYGLVTFAPLAMATTAPYNGKVGVPFKGTRYGLTEADGGASTFSSGYSEGFHVDPKTFRLELLELYSQIANGMNQTAAAAALTQTKSQFSNMSTGKIEGLWPTQVMPSLKPFFLFSFAEASKSTAAGKLIQAYTLKWAASGVLSYEYDSISSLGGFFGFKHPLQDFQPLSNKLIAGRKSMNRWNIVGRTSRNRLQVDRQPAAKAMDLPKADEFQVLFSIFANGGAFVNHDTCCYSSQDNELCSKQYDKPQYRICNNKLLAYMPKKPTATPGTTTTIAYTKLEGSLTVVAAGLTKPQIEAASKTSLAAHFAVDADRVTATATETRRLSVDGNDRRLAGTWTIAYAFQVSPAEVTAAKTKVATAASAPDAFKAALATNFKAALKTAGVSATVADALQVQSATAVAIDPVSGSTTGISVSGASETMAFLSFIIVMKTLFFSM